MTFSKRNLDEERYAKKRPYTRTSLTPYRACQRNTRTTIWGGGRSRWTWDAAAMVSTKFLHRKKCENSDSSATARAL